MDYEADRLEHRIDVVTDESLAATHRIRQMAEETNQIGVTTLDTLQDQGEQLNHIENRVDNIEVDLKEAEQHLHEIEKCCGCCVCPWNRARSTTKVRAQKRSNGGSQDPAPVITDQPRHNGNNKERLATGGGYIQRVTHDDRENEMNENLEVVADVLGNLKGIAQEMGNELDRQNKQLDRVNDKVQAQDDRLTPINQRIRRQLK